MLVLSMGRFEEILMKSRTRLLSITAAALLTFGSAGAFAQQHIPSKPTISSSNNLTFDTTPSDHARLREIFGNERAVQRLSHVKFSLAPGSVVPGSIRLTPLPQTIVKIEPTWQGNEYFKVGQTKVVIVDPQSKKIEGVLTM
jgi:Protein of unknown function (DUF1236)